MSLANWAVFLLLMTALFLAAGQLWSGWYFNPLGLIIVALTCMRAATVIWRPDDVPPSPPENPLVTTLLLTAPACIGGLYYWALPLILENYDGDRTFIGVFGYLVMALCLLTGLCAMFTRFPLWARGLGMFSNLFVSFLLFRFLW